MKAIPTVPIYGISVSKLDLKETVAYLTGVITSRRPHQVITANPIMVMSALENPAYMEIMTSAELVVPDGTGVVWAAQHCGNPVKERVAGFDLLHELLKAGESYQWKVYLLGSTAEVISETARRLQLQYPGIVIVGFRDGYFGPDEDEAVVSGIMAANPDILFVARGADSQEPWIAKYKSKLAIPVMMGVGGSFDVISGKSRRAPKAFQKLRLEWFYRLLKEPTRYRRMLALPKFALKVLRDKDKVTKVV
ncbi:WecB/TagA/CpsF family glycosyltransferase [Paenibacillus sp. sgz500958]|uniref:WecB/TagA/CpsF family glycosyltransferase n=1 Tax=Paenibacillus sp. sgz500958 TaxID=3242475 RepID=UPI0036D3E482